MAKTLEFTGGSKISDVLTHFGKVVNQGKRSVLLKLDFVSTLSFVGEQVQVNAADKADALASLSPAEAAAVAKYEAQCKANADARRTGKQVERWAIKGTIDLA